MKNQVFPSIIWAVVSLAAFTSSRDLHAQRYVPRLGELARLRLASDTTAGWLTGRVSNLSTTDLNIRSQLGQESTFSLATISQLELRRSTWMKHGAVIGAALGASIGLIAGESAATKLSAAGIFGISFGITTGAIARRYPRWIAIDIRQLVAHEFYPPRHGLTLTIPIGW